MTDTTPATTTPPRPIYLAIDSKSTRDVDDAIALVREAVGWRASVLIANPSMFIAPGSAEDEFARRQGATAYMGSRVLQSMLPRPIAEAKAALSDQTRRPVLKLDLDITAELDVTVAGLAFAERRIDAHVPYTDVAARARQADDAIASALREMIVVSQNLLGTRRSRGALAYYDLTQLLFLDEEGRMQRAKSREDAIGQILVQEFMILANSAIATWAVERDVPILFRNHHARAASPPPATVASNVESWMHGSALNEASIRDQLNLILGTASYGASVEGHYALNLPAYTHATSPIRRYPDLVTERQLVAAVRGESLPYTKDDLATLATELNATLAKRKAERSEGYKSTVVRRAADALGREHFGRLADHELGQVIKLALENDQFADALADEVRSRILAGTLSDKNLDRLLECPPRVPEAVRTAWAAVLTSAPHRAKHHLMHALQVGLFRDLGESDAPAGSQFCSRLEVVRVADGGTVSASATAGRKQDASNRATARLIMAHLGVEPAAASSAQMPDVPISNWKGRVQERCQKSRWPLPTYRATSTGPTHAPSFTCDARLDCTGGPILVTFAGGRTRMEAEQGAAQLLWEKLGSTGPEKTAQAPAQAPAHANPISALQERCQKAGLPVPHYEISGPPTGPFECRLTTELAPGAAFSASGPNKAEARRAAAVAALTGMT